MSPPDSTENRPGIYVQKAKNDIYTVMLSISLAAIIIACILLFVEWRRYGGQTKAALRTVPQVQLAAAALPAISIS